MLCIAKIYAAGFLCSCVSVLWRERFSFSQREAFIVALTRVWLSSFAFAGFSSYYGLLFCSFSQFEYLHLMLVEQYGTWPCFEIQISFLNAKKWSMAVIRLKARFKYIRYQLDFKLLWSNIPLVTAFEEQDKTLMISARVGWDNGGRELCCLTTVCFWGFPGILWSSQSSQGRREARIRWPVVMQPISQG